MRVGLLSKVVEHITLLVEDWFVGVRPRTLVVPCPHCSANQPHEPVTVCRSFSAAIELLPGAERREREWLQSKVRSWDHCRGDKILLSWFSNVQ